MKIKNKSRSHPCVLGIAPSSRGFGFAVMCKRNVLVDWGVKPVSSGNKNEQCLARLAELIKNYQPDAIAVENCSKGSRRASRIQTLIAQCSDMAETKGIEVRRLSRREVNLRILKHEDGTKHQIAETLSVKYSDQLGFRLPKKRRLWTSEPYQMDIFGAVALAQCYGGQIEGSRDE